VNIRALTTAAGAPPPLRVAARARAAIRARVEGRLTRAARLAGG
jgi:hypothetical protein